MAKSFSKFIGIIIVIAILLSLGVSTLAIDLSSVVFLDQSGSNVNEMEYTTIPNIIVVKQADSFVVWVDGTVSGTDAEIISAVLAAAVGHDGSLANMAKKGNFAVARNNPFNYGEELELGGSEYNVTVTIGSTKVTTSKPVSHITLFGSPPPPTGSLTVDKTVSGTGASGTEKFAITVAFTGNYTGITNNANLSGTNGTYLLSLSADDTPVTFSNIPMDVGYTVTEGLTQVQKDAGWSDAPTISNSSGTVNSTAAIAVNVNNSFTPPPVVDDFSSLIVRKNVSGRGAPQGEEFVIRVVFTGDGYAAINNSGGMTVTDGIYDLSLGDGESVRFYNIPEGVGYTVSETLSTAQTAAGWIRGDISNGTGEFSDAEDIIATVNNIAPPIFGSLAIDKLVSGNAATGSEKFNITVVFTLDNGNPIPQALTLGGGGPLSGIQNSRGIEPTTEGGGTYNFLLSGDDAPVRFSNIPEGVSYTVIETLTAEQTAAGWRQGTSTNDTGTIRDAAEINVSLRNSNSRTPPPVYNEYGSLKVEKNVSGDNASETEEFEITVLFTGNYAGIANNAGLSGPGGVYVLSLHDGESVIFSNIPMGVRYTVTEKLSEAQTTVGWVAPGPAEGIINSTTRVDLTVENVYAEAEPQGEDEDIEDPEDEDPVVDPEGDTEDLEPTLPQTGGTPKSAVLGLIGLLFVLSGTVLSIVTQRKKKE